jgi:hypothetical protein
MLAEACPSTEFGTYTGSKLDHAANYSFQVEMKGDVGLAQLDLRENYGHHVSPMGSDDTGDWVLA